MAEVEVEITTQSTLRILFLKTYLGPVWELFLKTVFGFLKQKKWKTRLTIKNCFLFFIHNNRKYGVFK